MDLHTHIVSTARTLLSDYRRDVTGISDYAAALVDLVADLTGTTNVEAYKALNTCSEPLNMPWRDEDVALMEPALRGITTCQRDTGHRGNHSPRTEASITAAYDALRIPPSKRAER